MSMAICCVRHAAGDLLGEALQRRRLSRLAPPLARIFTGRAMRTLPPATSLLTCGVPVESSAYGPTGSTG